MVAEAAEAAGDGEVVDGGGGRGCSPLRWVGLISHSARNRHPHVVLGRLGFSYNCFFLDRDVIELFVGFFGSNLIASGNN